MRTLLNFLERSGLERKNIKPFLIFLIGVVVVSIILITTPFFTTIGPVVLVVVFSVFLLILWAVAGYTVFRSLLATSVGLSLIIFIGQSYCALPVSEQVSNTSLMTLMGFGFIYVMAQFGRSLYKELFGDKEAREEWRKKGLIAIFKEINKNKHSWLILITYGLLVSLFVWQIYSVINPIIHGLCVYK